MNNGTAPATNARPLECFRLLVCQTAVQDARSGMWSYVNVIPQVTTDAAQLGQAQPFAVSLGIIGNGEYDVALSWLGEDDSSYIAGVNAKGLKIEGFVDLTVNGVVLPPKPGTYVLLAEWRPAGSEGPWQKTSARCPFVVALTKPKDAPAVEVARA